MTTWSNKSLQATPIDASDSSFAVTPAACAAVAPAPLGGGYWYGVPELLR